MKRENWEQVKDIFNRALTVVPAERAAFLSGTCAGDNDLRRDVEVLLSSFDSSESFLENVAIGQFADIIADDRARLQIGEIVAHYEILELLGVGGMGEVYLAHDKKLNRRVALKFFATDTADSSNRKRFIREAQAVAALEHPHICAIYEIAEADGRMFIAMQYIEGETLAERLKGKTLSVGETVDIAVQIAEALAEAHARGVVHRDIKPANIMLASRGGVKVLDFGLAKIQEPEPLDKDPRVSQKTTMPGLVMGTAAYMSPEQARGLPVDGRTDIWSLGVVLHETLAGALPFAGDTTSDIIAAILTAEPTPVDIDAGQNGELLLIIRRSLAKNLGDRYSSAVEMLAALRSLQKQINSEFERPTIPNLQISGRASVYQTNDTVRNTNREDPGSRPAARSARLRWLTAALALTVVAAGFGGYRALVGSLPLTAAGDQKPPTPTMRGAVALIGFRDLSKSERTAWLSPALVEMLSTELAAGEKLRLIPQENVSRMKSEISLGEADSLLPETLQKVGSNLGAELIVSGTYLVLSEGGGEQIRLDLRVRHSANGETAATIAEAGPKSNLFELVSRVGARLREALGAGLLNDTDKSALRASQPANAEAVRLYAEGREKLNNFDFLPARDLLEAAVAADPGFSLSHMALAMALQKLGEEADAKAASEKAFELSERLQREERLLVEAFYRETNGERDKAIEIYSTLVDFFPDDLEYGLRLASAQRKAGRSTDALSAIERLRRLPAPVSDDPRIDITEADAAEALSDYKRELDLARSAAEKGIGRNAFLLVAEARYYEGWALWNLGENAAALAAYEQARRTYNDAGRRKSVADVLNAVASVHWKQGEFEKALRIYKECLSILRETGSKIGAAAALNNIANIYKDRDELSDARRNYEEALALEKQIGIKTRIAVVIFNLAGVRKVQGDLNEAEKMYGESLAMARETGRQAQITMSLQELAEIAYYRDDLKAARSLAEESLAVAREIKRRSSEAYTLATLGRIAIAAGDLAAAREHIERSLEIRHELGEGSVLAESQVLLAQLALAENRPAEALLPARIAAEVFAKEKTLSSEAEARTILALADLGTGDHAAGLAEITKATTLINAGENKPSEFIVRIGEAKIMAATNRQAKAKQILSKVARESSRLGYEHFARAARTGGV